MRPGKGRCPPGNAGAHVARFHRPVGVGRHFVHVGHVRPDSSSTWVTARPLCPMRACSAMSSQSCGAVRWRREQTTSPRYRYPPAGGHGLVELKNGRGASSTCTGRGITQAMSDNGSSGQLGLFMAGYFQGGGKRPGCCWPSATWSRLLAIQAGLGRSGRAGHAVVDGLATPWSPAPHRRAALGGPIFDGAHAYLGELGQQLQRVQAGGFFQGVVVFSSPTSKSAPSTAWVVRRSRRGRICRSAHRSGAIPRRWRFSSAPPWRASTRRTVLRPPGRRRERAAPFDHHAQAAGNRTPISTWCVGDALHLLQRLQHARQHGRARCRTARGRS